MRRSGVIGAGLAIAGVVAGLAVAPAVGATEESPRASKRLSAASRALSGFTPAAADPRLAAIYARSGLDRGKFRFTPAEVTRGDKSVTVAVRARSTRGAGEDTQVANAPAPTVGIAPIAYNLGVAVGWKRFAASGEVARVDLALQPGSRETADVGVSYAGRRFTGQVRAAADRPLPGSPKLVEGAESYSLDVGGSYSLTRNLDVTAGVRYKSERERLARVNDNRRDSQAVYVGTAFRF